MSSFRNHHTVFQLLAIYFFCMQIPLWRFLCPLTNLLDYRFFFFKFFTSFRIKSWRIRDIFWEEQKKISYFMIITSKVCEERFFSLFNYRSKTPFFSSFIKNGNVVRRELLNTIQILTKWILFSVFVWNRNAPEEINKLNFFFPFILHFAPTIIEQLRHRLNVKTCWVN